MEKTKSKKKGKFGLVSYALAIFLIGLIAISGISYAYKGDPSTVGPNYNEEAHDSMINAIDSGDYNAWIAVREQFDLPMKGKIFSIVNEDNFKLFKEIREARLSGDLDRANEIREGLGLGQGSMNRGSMKSINRKSNFVDSDNDGICDNMNRMNNRGMGRHKNW